MGGTAQGVLDLVAARITDQLRSVGATAQAGDETYGRLLKYGRDKDLEMALKERVDV
jgi:hypothetical protein